MPQEMPGSDFTPTLKPQLQVAGQAHLIRYYEHLGEKERKSFLQQLQEVDWPLVRQLNQMAQTGTDHAASATSNLQHIQPPEHLVRQPTSDAERNAWNEARQHGENLLRSGKVAAVVVAGGQGTRLGFDLPKGMFPIGPVSGHSLFRIFCEQIRARSRHAGHTIPNCIMTSDATHQATVNYFQQHRHFDLPKDAVHFFRQGSLPAVDIATGQALLSAPGELALSPDGHGGMLRALVHSGLLDQLEKQGVETLFYHQVDNPTTQICDPAFLGWHALRQAEVSTKVVAKRSAEEKMGVAVSLNGVSQIIEYSDLPPELAAKTDAQSRLWLWSGNTAIHVFQLEFLRRMASDGQAFPFHIAQKAVRHVTASGELVTPEKPNARKFEQFIFDLLPAAKRSLIVEADRAAEFNPVKNNEGHDSPASCRAALQTLHRQWVRAAGGVLSDDMPMEISPLFALNAEEAAARIAPGTTFEKPTFLTTDS